jgi:hypothetical protein
MVCNFGSGGKLIHRSGPTFPFDLGETEIPENEAVIGWRSWGLGPKWVLLSTFKRVPWHPGRVMQADALTSQGNSGLYAFKEESYAINQGGEVWGQVALWGNIYNHTSRYRSSGDNGYRAQFGYPVSLFTTQDKVAQALLKTYGQRGTFINLASKYNPRDPGRITFLN